MEKRKRVPNEPSVFEQIGFSTEEAATLDLKTELLSSIVRCAKNYTQNELQGLLKEPQPRISNLLRGKISKFSVETLLEYAAALHMRPEIVLHKPDIQPVAVMHKDPARELAAM